MTFSLSEFVLELEITLIQSQSLQSTAETGSFAFAYELVFGLISVDADGNSFLSRDQDTDGNNVIVDRFGNIVLRIGQDGDGNNILTNGVGTPIDFTQTFIDSDTRFGSLEPAPGVDPGAWVFLRGVPDVNNNVGDYNLFIREYSKAQFQLRFPDDDITEAELDARVQDTSDAIAENILQDILSIDNEDGNFDPELNPNNFLPDIDGIASQDAQAAAIELFGEDENGGPNANIAGWAGNPFLIVLGHTSSYQDNILEFGGDQSNPFDVLALIASIKSVAAQLGVGITANLITDVLFRILPDAGDFVDNASTVLSILDQTNSFIQGIYGDDISLADTILSNLTVDTLGTNSALLVPSTSQTALDGNFIFAGDGNDTVFAALETGTDQDILDGGSGTDTLSYQNFQNNPNLGIIAIEQDASDILAESQFFITNRGTLPNTSDLAYNFESFVLTNQDDLFVATNTAVTVDGGGGDDELTGGLGNDTLIGGAGFDTVDYSARVEGIAYDQDRGEVRIDLQGTNVDEVDDLSGIEQIIGTAQTDTFRLTDPDQFQENFITNIDGGDGFDTVQIATSFFDDRVGQALDQTGEFLFDTIDSGFQNVELFTLDDDVTVIADTSVNRFYGSNVNYSAGDVLEGTGINLTLSQVVSDTASAVTVFNTANVTLTNAQGQAIVHDLGGAQTFFAVNDNWINLKRLTPARDVA